MIDREDGYSSDHGGDYIRPTEEYRSDCEDYHEHGQTYEDYDSEQHSYDAHNAAEDEFAGMLISGEHILWAGQSKRKLGIAEGCMAAPTLIFAIFWLTFAIFWTMGASVGGGLMGLFGIPFILIGIMLIVKTLNPGKKYYAITNMRVLRKEGKQLRTERLETLQNVSMGRHSGNLGYITYRSTDTAYYTRDGRQPGLPGNLVGIENVDEVYRILSEAIYNCTRLQ